MYQKKYQRNNGKNKVRYSFLFSCNVAFRNVTACNDVAYMQQLIEDLLQEPREANSRYNQQKQENGSNRILFFIWSQICFLKKMKYTTISLNFR
jgi:hypothetical protein